MRHIISRGMPHLILMQALLRPMTVATERDAGGDSGDGRLRTDQELDIGHNASMNAGKETNCFQVWFHGDHSLLYDEARAFLLSEDPFLYAGHYAISSVEDGPCSPRGWSPKSTATGQVLLALAKLGNVFPGQWLDDTHHFQRACKESIKVFFEEVECGTGKVPDVGYEQKLLAETFGQVTLEYGFPPRPPKSEQDAVVPDPKWGDTKFNCITLGANMHKLQAGAGEVSADHNPCINTGWSCQQHHYDTRQIRHCKKEGANWCDACPHDL